MESAALKRNANLMWFGSLFQPGNMLLLYLWPQNSSNSLLNITRVTPVTAVLWAASCFSVELNGDLTAFPMVGVINGLLDSKREEERVAVSLQ